MSMEPSCGAQRSKHSTLHCREQAKELLNRGWAAGEEPLYSADHALVVCRMHGFSDCLNFLYDRMRLFREGLKVPLALHHDSH